jgi:hypothetical protein
MDAKRHICTLAYGLIILVIALGRGCPELMVRAPAVSPTCRWPGRDCHHWVFDKERLAVDLDFGDPLLAHGATGRLTVDN